MLPSCERITVYPSSRNKSRKEGQIDDGHSMSEVDFVLAEFLDWPGILVQIPDNQPEFVLKVYLPYAAQASGYVLSVLRRQLKFKPGSKPGIVILKLDKPVSLETMQITANVLSKMTGSKAMGQESKKGKKREPETTFDLEKSTLRDLVHVLDLLCVNSSVMEPCIMRLIRMESLVDLCEWLGSELTTHVITPRILSSASELIMDHISKGGTDMDLVYLMRNGSITGPLSHSICQYQMAWRAMSAAMLSCYGSLCYIGSKLVLKCTTGGSKWKLAIRDRSFNEKVIETNDIISAKQMVYDIMFGFTTAWVEINKFRYSLGSFVQAAMSIPKFISYPKTVRKEVRLMMMLIVRENPDYWQGLHWPSLWVQCRTSNVSFFGPFPRSRVSPFLLELSRLEMSPGIINSEKVPYSRTDYLLIEGTRIQIPPGDLLDQMTRAKPDLLTKNGIVLHADGPDCYILTSEAWKPIHPGRSIPALNQLHWTAMPRSTKLLS